MSIDTAFLAIDKTGEIFSHEFMVNLKVSPQKELESIIGAFSKTNIQSEWSDLKLKSQDL